MVDTAIFRVAVACFMRVYVCVDQSSESVEILEMKVQIIWLICGMARWLATNVNPLLSRMAQTEDKRRFEKEKKRKRKENEAKLVKSAFEMTLD